MSHEEHPGCRDQVKVVGLTLLILLLVCGALILAWYFSPWKSLPQGEPGKQGLVSNLNKAEPTSEHSDQKPQPEKVASANPTAPSSSKDTVPQIDIAKLQTDLDMMSKNLVVAHAQVTDLTKMLEAAKVVAKTDLDLQTKAVADAKDAQAAAEKKRDDALARLAGLQKKLDEAQAILQKNDDARNLLRKAFEATVIKKSLTVKDDTVTALAFSKDGTRLICGTAKGKMLVWEIGKCPSEPSLLRGIALPIATVAIEGDVAAAASGTVFHVWQVSSGKDVTAHLDQPVSRDIKQLYIKHETLQISYEKTSASLPSLPTDFRLQVWVQEDSPHAYCPISRTMANVTSQGIQLATLPVWVTKP